MAIPRKAGIDVPLVAVTLALLFTGLVMVYSSSSIMAEHRFGSQYHFIKRQAVAVLAGLVALGVLCRVRVRLLEKIARGQRELGQADGRHQRRVLEQRDEVIGHGGERNPEGLRPANQPERLEFGEAQRAELLTGHPVRGFRFFQSGLRGHAVGAQLPFAVQRLVREHRLRDRFRRDLGGLLEAYTEVAKRLGIMNEGEPPRGTGPVLVKG